MMLIMAILFNLYAWDLLPVNWVSKNPVAHRAYLAKYGVIIKSIGVLFLFFALGSFFRNAS